MRRRRERERECCDGALADTAAVVGDVGVSDVSDDRLAEWRALAAPSLPGPPPSRLEIRRALGEAAAEVERLREENEVLTDDRQVALLDKRHAEAEVERLNDEHDDWCQERGDLRAEVETLRQRERDWLAGEQRVQAEVERLRAEFSAVLGDATAFHARLDAVRAALDTASTEAIARYRAERGPYLDGFSDGVEHAERIARAALGDEGAPHCLDPHPCPNCWCAKKVRRLVEGRPR